MDKNPRYSRNAFARSLGVDPTYLSKLFSGSILLSLEIADKIAKRLNFDTETRARFLDSVAEEHKCHSLYSIDPSLTDCDPTEHEVNLKPVKRA
jgi:transcriptional regulator with XRE-family HTH domain